MRKMSVRSIEISRKELLIYALIPRNMRELSQSDDCCTMESAVDVYSYYNTGNKSIANIKRVLYLDSSRQHRVIPMMKQRASNRAENSLKMFTQLLLLKVGLSTSFLAVAAANKLKRSWQSCRTEFDTRYLTRRINTRR